MSQQYPEVHRDLAKDELIVITGAGGFIGGAVERRTISSVGNTISSCSLGAPAVKRWSRSSAPWRPIS